MEEAPQWEGQRPPGSAGRYRLSLIACKCCGTWSWGTDPRWRLWAQNAPKGVMQPASSSVTPLIGNPLASSNSSNKKVGQDSRQPLNQPAGQIKPGCSPAMELRAHTAIWPHSLLPLPYVPMVMLSTVLSRHYVLCYLALLCVSWPYSSSLTGVFPCCGTLGCRDHAMSSSYLTLKFLPRPGRHRHDSSKVTHTHGIGVGSGNCGPLYS